MYCKNMFSGSRKNGSAHIWTQHNECVQWDTMTYNPPTTKACQSLLVIHPRVCPRLINVRTKTFFRRAGARWQSQRVPMHGPVGSPQRRT